jgi:hypothetical protein
MRPPQLSLNIIGECSAAPPSPATDFSIRCQYCAILRQLSRNIIDVCSAARRLTGAARLHPAFARRVIVAARRLTVAARLFLTFARRVIVAARLPPTFVRRVTVAARQRPRPPAQSQFGVIIRCGTAPKSDKKTRGFWTEKRA